MKKYIGFLFGFILTALCSGCIFQTETTYEFRQDADQINSIEILRKEYDSIDTDTPMYVVKELESSEYQTVLDGIRMVDGGRNGLDPTTGFGLYVIRITYKNGEMEMIGNYSTGYISVDGETHQEHYSFNIEQYYDLISALMGEEITDYTLG